MNPTTEEETLFPSGSTPFERETTTTLERIDRAIEATRQAAHASYNPATREYFEYALALLRESWIAEGGQPARGARQVIDDVEYGLRLVAWVFASEKEH